MFIDITFFGKIAFQSPRSGKFVSNRVEVKEMKGGTATMFQSPRSGKFVSNLQKLKQLL